MFICTCFVNSLFTKIGLYVFTATDLSQMQLPDGVVVPPAMQNPSNPYNRYNTPYAPVENEPYSPATSYGYPMKGYEKPEESNYNYNTSYTPPQFSTQVADPQTYSNPYYSATQNNSTVVTDTQITMSYGNANQANVVPNPPQYGSYETYNTAPQMGLTPESMSTMSGYHNSDMSMNFAQMHVSAPKSEPGSYGADYSQTYYSIQYPQAATPNMATYSNAPQNSNTNMTSSQIPSDYNSLNYPYSTDPQGMQQVNPNVSTPYSSVEQYSYNNYISQAYPIYTNSESNITSTTSVVSNPVSLSNYSSNVVSHSALPINSTMANPTNLANYSSMNPMNSIPNNVTNVPINMANPVGISESTNLSNTPLNVVQPYTIPEQDSNYIDPAVLSQLDALDQPIKSHVTGEALASHTFQPTYQSYPNSAVSYPTEQNVPTTNYQFPNQTPNVTYAQTYQNHPGYNFNASTGTYEYNYGSQNSYNYTDQSNMNSQPLMQEQNWSAQGVYTSAGNCETVQSPSETPALQQTSVDQPNNNQTYYHAPYGYQTTIQSNVVVPESQPDTTNYGANMNQSTYMQSGQGQDTSVTFSNNQGKS